MLFAMATAMHAQEAALRKYTVLDDVSTTTISKGMIGLLPKDNLGALGIGKILDKIENIQLITTSKSKISKKMYKKLPKALIKEDFDVKLNTKQGMSNIRIMQKSSDLSRVVAIIYNKPQVTVVYLKGSFEASDFEAFM